MLQQVADGVHRFADGMVNWYLVEDDTGMILIDTGWPNSWSNITDALVQVGRPVADLKAVLLTHGHADHLGAAERARKTLGIPVHVHAHEAQRARGKANGSSSFALVPGLLPNLWRPQAFKFVLHATRHGFMTPTWVDTVSVIGEDGRLELPGNPTMIPCHGHTEGHVAYSLPDRGVVFSGDALVTLDVLTGETGPRLLPDALNADPLMAMTSLSAFEQLDAQVLLPGHGDPWRGTPADAVAQARGRSGS